MQKQSMQLLSDQGESVERIARRFGKDPSTVSYWMKKYGLTSPYADKHAAKGGIERERLEALVKSGMTLVEIAAEVERSVATVRHWLGRYGLRTSNRVGRRPQKTVREAKAAGQLTVAMEEAGGCCCICGYDRHPSALQFHHLDPELKRMPVSARGFALGLKTLRAEARKCVLLCSNCHAEVEAGAVALPLELASRPGFHPAADVPG